MSILNNANISGIIIYGLQEKPYANKYCSKGKISGIWMNYTFFKIHANFKTVSMVHCTRTLLLLSAWMFCFRTFTNVLTVGYDFE